MTKTLKTGLMVTGGLALASVAYYFGETKGYVPAFFTKMGKKKPVIVSDFKEEAKVIEDASKGEVSPDIKVEKNFTY